MSLKLTNLKLLMPRKGTTIRQNWLQKCGSSCSKKGKRTTFSRPGPHTKVGSRRSPHEGGISACLHVPDARERCVGHLRTMIPLEVVVNVRQAVGGRRHGCAHLVVGVIRLFVRAVDARDGLGKTEVPRVVALAAAFHAIDAVHLHLPAWL